jgi:Lipocalin-like domain
MKSIFLTTSIAFFLITNSVAQSLVGKWKLVANEITEADGKKSDMIKEIPKTMPCLANVVQEFLPNGRTNTILPADCGAMKAAVEKINKSTRWTMSGNKVTVTSDVIEKDKPTTATVSFQGNTMIWVYVYTEKDYNPTKLKSIRMVYKRV